MNTKSYTIRIDTACKKILVEREGANAIKAIFNDENVSFIEFDSLNSIKQDKIEEVRKILIDSIEELTRVNIDNISSDGDDWFLINNKYLFSVLHEDLRFRSTYGSLALSEILAMRRVASEYLAMVQGLSNKLFDRNKT